MSYASDLLADINAPSSAYLQYILERDSGDFSGFVFVEDKPDVLVYQHVLTNFENLAFFGCGGKSAVMKVFARIRDEERLKGCLFIVDKDTEVRPFVDEQHVLRTSMYSWESHVCTPEVVYLLLGKLATPTLSKAKRQDIVSKWKKTTESFRGEFAKQYAILRASYEADLTVGVSAMPLLKDCEITGVLIVPSKELCQWLDAKRDDIVALGVARDWLDKVAKETAGAEVQEFGRGKALFSLLKTFIRHAIEHHGKQVNGDASSALSLLHMISPDHPQLEYLRSYAAERLAA